MGLSCIPPPASLKPPKVYNILVPDVFPRNAPGVNDALDEAQRRKFSKLAEYVRNNPAKIPKVSRRLYRTAMKSIGNTKNMGYVNVAVNAYILLLDQCHNESSPYTSNYFAQELVLSPKSLIHETFDSSSKPLQVLGAQLLAAFISAQDSIIHMDTIGQYVLEACNRLQAEPSSDSEEVSHMKVVRAHVASCLKLNMVPLHLEEVQAAVIRILRANNGHQASRAVAMDVASQLRDHSTELASIHATVKARLHQGSPAQQQDRLKALLQSFSQDHAEHRFTVMSALFNHIIQCPTTCQEASAIVQMGTSEAARLASEHAVSMLGLALHKLPSIYMLQSERRKANPQELTQLKATIHSSIAQLAARAGSFNAVYEVVSNYLGSEDRLSETESESMVETTARLECAAGAIKAVEKQDGAAPLRFSLLPPSFVAFVSTVLCTAQLPDRLLAHSILEPMLTKGNTVDDATYAESLQCALLSEVGLSDSTPKEFCAMAALLKACIGGSSTAGGNAVVALAKAVAQVAPVGATAHRACCGFQLVNEGLEVLKQAGTRLQEYQLPTGSSCDAFIKVDGDSMVPVSDVFSEKGTTEGQASAVECGKKVQEASWGDGVLRVMDQAAEAGPRSATPNPGTRLVQLLNEEATEFQRPPTPLPALLLGDDLVWQPATMAAAGCIPSMDSFSELEAALQA